MKSIMDFLNNRAHKTVFSVAKNISDNDSETSSASRKYHAKKQNHCEIEKRRRDKMNRYIHELSSLIPLCKRMPRKLDKLTILKMAVQHIKLSNNSSNHSEIYNSPPFFSDEKLKHLLLQSMNGFLLVIGLDQGCILFVSESVKEILNYNQTDVVGQSLFDIVHSMDIAIVKEQLFSKEHALNNMLSFVCKSEYGQMPHPGAFRSFYCRMKCQSPYIKHQSDAIPLKNQKLHYSSPPYRLVHCTGYMKSLSNKFSNNVTWNCLIVVVHVPFHISSTLPQIQEIRTEPIEFSYRLSINGKFLVIDQRATLVLGYLQQEIEGTSIYDYLNDTDVTHVSRLHKYVLQMSNVAATCVYKFRVKKRFYVTLKSSWKAFRNPWTKKNEYIVIISNVISAGSDHITKPHTLNSQFHSLSSVPTIDITSDNHSGYTVLESKRFKPSTDSDHSTMSKIVNTQLHSFSPVANSDIVSDTKTTCPDLQAKKSRLSNIYASNYDPSTKSHAVNTQINSLLPVLDVDKVSRNDIGHAVLKIKKSRACNPNEVCIPKVTNESCSAEISHQNSTQNCGFSAASNSSQITEYSDKHAETSTASYQNVNSEGSDEAAMASLMNLLEADAGLGGPVDFSGLPWPLP